MSTDNPTLIAEDRPHHPYSPSTLQTREWCPMFKNRQTEKVHQRATAGTRAHSVVDSGEDDTRLSDDDALAAAECMDFVDLRRRLMEATAREAYEELLKTMPVNTVVPMGPSPVEELSEVYLPIDDRKFPDCESTTAGYVDKVLINYNCTYAEMFDWKFGIWPVEAAKDNLQGIAYVLGLFRLYPTLKHIRFYFKQPLLGVVSEHEFSREDIPALYLRVQTVVARARLATETSAWHMANPAVPACNFCDRLGTCPKVAAFACVVGHKFHPLAVPAEINPSLINSPQGVVDGLRLSGVLKIWCEAFRRQASDRIIRGDAPLPPGQKIQEMQKRIVVDEAKLKGVALRFLTSEEYSSTLSPTFGDLEDLIKEKAPRGQKEATVKEFQRALFDAGAVKLGDKFSFLRAVAVKE
jgi:hypothetical protein